MLMTDPNGNELTEEEQKDIRDAIGVVDADWYIQKKGG